MHWAKLLDSHPGPQFAESVGWRRTQRSTGWASGGPVADPSRPPVLGGGRGSRIALGSPPKRWTGGV